MEDLLSASESCPELAMPCSQIAQVLVPFFRIHDELCIDGALVLRGEHRAIVPAALCSQQVNLAHEKHQGTDQTKRSCVTYSGGLRWMLKCNLQFLPA